MNENDTLSRLGIANAYIEALEARVAELEAENKLLDGYRVHADAHRALLAKYDAEKNGWLDIVGKASHAINLFAKLEGREKQRVEDEAWANGRTVLVEFHPVTSGWYASASDGVVGINATAPTIHGALRALREKMEARPAETAEPCPHCFRVECECSDFDAAPDMGDK